MLESNNRYILRFRQLIYLYLCSAFSRRTPLRCMMRFVLENEVAKYVKEGVCVELGATHKILTSKSCRFYFTQNIDKNVDVDIIYDVTKPYPFKEEVFDNVLSFNLIEHVKCYHCLIENTYKYLKKGGVAIFFVPYIMFYHPSPKDYWRFSEDALREMFSTFKHIRIIPVGFGPYLASNNLKSLVYNRFPFRLIKPISLLFAIVMDSIIATLYTILNKISSNVNRVSLLRRFPLGYFIVATK